MRIFIELMPKQPLSCEPNGYILVGFNGVPPLTQEAISEKSRIDRAQRNLKLGGNTVKRPMYIGAFFVGTIIIIDISLDINKFKIN